MMAVEPRADTARKSEVLANAVHGIREEDACTTKYRNIVARLNVDYAGLMRIIAAISQWVLRIVLLRGSS
jgi:hypothetical protein